jgi:hypothetical protein
MQANSHFNPGKTKDRNVLHHWDLEPRNIIVQQEEVGTQVKWHIAGVLDWDDALSLPIILCRQPPAWLWDPSYSRSSRPLHNDFDSDVNSLAPTYYSDLKGDALQIKQHFEAEYLDKVMTREHNASTKTYVDGAYGTGRWLRLWRFALYGFSSDQDVARLDKLEREWLEHCSI